MGLPAPQMYDEAASPRPRLSGETEADNEVSYINLGIGSASEGRYIGAGRDKSGPTVSSPSPGAINRGPSINRGPTNCGRWCQPERAVTWSRHSPRAQLVMRRPLTVRE